VKSKLAVSAVLLKTNDFLVIFKKLQILPLSDFICFIYVFSAVECLYCKLFLIA